MRQLLGFALLSLVACAAAQPKPTAQAGEASAQVVRPGEGGVSALRVGQRLEIELPGNASTGYQWQLVEDGSPVVERIMPAASAEESRPSGDPKMVGTPDMTRWWFKAARPGQTVLRLVYRRPWETDAPPARTAEYPLTVE